MTMAFLPPEAFEAFIEIQSRFGSRMGIPDISPSDEVSDSNPMNCHNCDHKKVNDDPSLWCYMFKNEPTERCLQFTSHEMKIRPGKIFGI